MRNGEWSRRESNPRPLECHAKQGRTPPSSTVRKHARNRGLHSCPAERRGGAMLEGIHGATEPVCRSHRVAADGGVRGSLPAGWSQLLRIPKAQGGGQRGGGPSAVPVERGGDQRRVRTCQLRDGRFR